MNSLSNIKNNNTLYTQNESVNYGLQTPKKLRISPSATPDYDVVKARKQRAPLRQKRTLSMDDNIRRHDLENDFEFPSSSFEFSDSDISGSDYEEGGYPLTPTSLGISSKSDSIFFERPREIKEANEVFTKPSIFDVPEILHKIISYVDFESSFSSYEITPLRRRPISKNHAMLLYGNEYEAALALKTTESTGAIRKGSLYNLLFVNKLFYQVTKAILNTKVQFNDEKTFRSFLEGIHNTTGKPKPSVITLHKLFHTNQKCIDFITKNMDLSNLSFLEFYMCPKIVPSMEFFNSVSSLKKLVITGSKVIDDHYLRKIASRCSGLEILDLRACERVTDSGVYQISKYCRRLVHINLGRKNKGHLITDASVNTLVRNNSKLRTVGLAGCYITDKTIWSLATHCSDSLERLSLNKCPLITNSSLPLIFYSNFMQNLSVLEIRFVPRLSNFKPIIEFKRRQELKGFTFLLEICEELCVKIREQELEMDKSISKRIFKDIIDWANDTNDGDANFSHFLLSRS